MGYNPPLPVGGGSSSLCAIMDSNLPPPNPPPPPPSSPPPLASPPRLSVPPRKNQGWKVAVVILVCLLAASLLSNFWQVAHSFLKRSTTARHGGPRLEE